MNAYFACYDYGMGGIWFRILAPSALDIYNAFPQLVVFANEPDWLKKNPKNDLPVYRLGDPLSHELAVVLDEANKNGVTGKLV